MHRLQARVLGAVFLAHLAVAAASGQIGVPTIQVDTFANPANFQRSTIGNALTDIFVTELARAGRFRVLDRSFGSPAFAGEGVGAEPDFHFVAKVTNFSYQERTLAVEAVEAGEGAASQAEYEETIQVRIDFRLVDGKSREVIFADIGERVETNRSTVSRVADFDRLVAARASNLTTEVMGSMMGRASLDAVGAVVSRLNEYIDIAGFAEPDLEGPVLGVVNDGMAVIGIGAGDGLRVNDILKLMRITTLHDSQGEVIYSSREETGRVRVAETQYDRALAWREGDAAIREGDVVVLAGSSTSPEERVSKAGRFIEAGFFAPALREAERARREAPGLLDARVAEGTAALYMMDYARASDAYHEVMSADVLTFAVVHAHTFGSCRGTLTLGRGFVSFSSGEEDDPDHWFEVSVSGISEMVRTSRGWRIRAPSGEGEEKNWTFSTLGYSSEVEPQLTSILEDYIRGY